jgi:GR25 family glycosyltransferase involved in LPS biosynthesis
MSDKTICLNMIVKNEAHVILSTLTNLCSYINFSYWVISDTGSTDDTKELIIDFFKDKGIKGELVEHAWKDFGYNRTKALECAYNKSDYILIFDADDKIWGNFKMLKTFDYDSYAFTFGQGFTYIRTLLVNNRKKWSYKGVLHEYIVNDEPINGQACIQGDYYVESGRTGNRSKNPNKYLDDANVLKKAYYDELERDVKLAYRYAFYCAQSYKDSGAKYHDDSIEWYTKCLDLDMWAQEKYMSCVYIGNMYLEKHDIPNALKYYYKTVEYDAERIDGIILALQILQSEGNHTLVNALYHKFKNYKRVDSDKLFINELLYDDILEYINSISAYYVHDKESGYECSKKIFINNKLNHSALKLTISNFKFYMDLLDKDTEENALQLFYAFDTVLYTLSDKGEQIDSNVIDVWNKLFEKCKHLLVKPLETKFSFKKSNKPTILLSFTTCKRIDLFTQTINSMLNHWLDIGKIEYWFCVDDNSSTSDRNKMRKLYPWINYYMKDENEKGHKQSMNIIWNKLNELKPTYWIHMEDDFLFHKQMNYIEEAINALQNDKLISQNVKQILFNRNYGETIDNYNVLGHDAIDNNTNIVLHNFDKDKKSEYLNCHYWPHYSFRPSLVDVKTILELGNFDSETSFFERNYADNWEKSGYKSAFFNKITCRHIGRLTKDINNTDHTKNAYELNGENQFNAKNNANYIKIVNLERREDRKTDMIQKLKDANIETSNYEFIKAVDGSTLKPTIEIYNMFKGNDFGNREGVIGCALTHIQLWQQLLGDMSHDYYLIMEDDCTFHPEFKTYLEQLKESGVFASKNFVFLGYHMFDKDRKDNYHIYNTDSETKTLKVEPLNRTLYIGATFAYSVNKTGARKFLDHISKHGVKHGIDYYYKILPILEAYECQHQIVFSDWNESGKDIDSDIQNIYKAIDFSEMENEYKKAIENVENEFTFIPNLDIIGSDLYYCNASNFEKMVVAQRDEACVAFNTLGFFKNDCKLSELKGSNYFKEGDGIYVKKTHYNKMLVSDSITISETQTITNKSLNTRIKMICNWTTSEQLCKEWSNMCESEFSWKNYELVWTNNKEEIDYYVIINSPNPQENAYFDPKRTIVFQMEPWVEDENKNWGVKTWGQWAEPDPDKFLAVHGRKTGHCNNCQWLLELPLQTFYKSDSDAFKKGKETTISSICSPKYFDEGHIDRIEFLKFLEKKGDILLDIYGYANNHNLENYRGALSNDNKSDGLTSYKYYFIVENNYETNYITEKLWEPILCECLCFYYGAPNVTDYIDSRAIVVLDMKDFEKSYQIIKSAIEEDLWSQRIDIIRQEKQKILNELAFFPTIDKIITASTSTHSA